MTYTERRKATIDKFINIDSIDDLKEVEAGLDEFAEYVRAEERVRVVGGGIEQYKNYYNPIGDAFNKGKHQALDDLLPSLLDKPNKYI